MGVPLYGSVEDSACGGVGWDEGMEMYEEEGGDGSVRKRTSKMARKHFTSRNEIECISRHSDRS